ncbi:hypothetical protein N9Q82_04250 [Gammaproteobacteria bacterium]|nr:hypothetical protein [Gammaproteobacteria bacterium]
MKHTLALVLMVFGSFGAFAEPKSWSELDDELNEDVEILQELNHIECVFDQSRNITDDVGTNDTVPEGIFTSYFAFNSYLFFSKDESLKLIAILNPDTSKWIPRPGVAEKFNMTDSQIEYSFTPTDVLENSFELTEVSGLVSINRLNGIMSLVKRYKYEITGKTRGMNVGNYAIVKRIGKGNCDSYDPSKSKF